MKNSLITKVLSITAALFLCCCFMAFYTAGGASKTVFAERNHGESAIVIERDSGRILFAENAFDKKFMASTTKIVTAITVIENCNLDEVVTVKKETVGIEGSSIYLEEGEKLTVKDLLYGLMLRSGNDAAETLADFCGNGTENFVRMMNETAQKVGAKNSNFVNPHGLHDDNHYTTAYDMAIITAYALKNETFREIVSCRVKEIPWSTRSYNRRLVNKNKMLAGFEGATGVKTGFTKNAGRCLVSSCLRGDMELICVVLNCPPMFEKSKALLSEAFENFKPRKLVCAENIIGFVARGNETEKVGMYIKDDIILPLTDKEFENCKIVYDYPETIGKNVKKDEEIGSIKIYCENNLIFSQKIYTLI